MDEVADNDVAEMSDGLQNITFEDPPDDGDDDQEQGMITAEGNQELKQDEEGEVQQEQADDEDEEDNQEEGLKPSSKHILVLGNSGKPIFTRHGDEQRLAPLMGVIQAIISFSQTATGHHDINDCIRSITAGRRRFVFLIRKELYLLAVTTTREPEPYLKLQLEYVYQQIVFLLTAKRIERSFATNPSYDLRELLGGTQKVLSGIADMTLPTRESSANILTGSISTLPLDPILRLDISRALLIACTPANMLYGILFCNSRLITLIQPRDGRLHLQASDLTLFSNFIITQPSFRNAESWTPICLPRFNDSGFLYSYVAYLDAPTDVYLLLVSANDDPEQFKACCQCRTTFENIMREKNWLKGIHESAAEHRSKALARYSNSAMAFHYIYKYCPSRAASSTSSSNGGGGGGGAASSSKSSSSSSPSALGTPYSMLLSQCISSSFFFPYIDDEAKQSVWNRYATALLQLRYGGRSRWRHAGDWTDRPPSKRPPSGGSTAATPNGEAATAAAEGGGLASSNGEEGGGGCMMDVFEKEADHSLVYEIRETDCIVVNVGPDFELFALMSAAPELTETIQSLNRLIRSIKREERWLFMTQALYW